MPDASLPCDRDPTLALRRGGHGYPSRRSARLGTFPAAGSAPFREAGEALIPTAWRHKRLFFSGTSEPRSC